MHRTIIQVLSLLFLATATNCLHSLANSKFEDWVVSPEKHPLCGGYYQEPLYPYLQSKAQCNIDCATHINSDEADFNQNGIAHFTGNVKVTKGNQSVLSNKAHIYRNPQTRQIEKIEASGNVQMTEPNFRIEGTDIALNPSKNTKQINNASFRIYSRHGRGEAESITQVTDDRLLFKKASYTTCAPYDTVWQLKAHKIKLDKTKGRGHAQNATLYFKSIPVMYTPFIDFPIDSRRQTGFLFPYFGNSNLNGTEIITPFYWNIAPNYDALINPRYLSKRGMDLQNHVRYLSPHSQGHIKVNVLHNDKAYAKFITEKKAYPDGLPSNSARVQGLRHLRNRYFLHAKNNTHITPAWNFAYDVAKVSDDNYFYDLGTRHKETNTEQLLQEALLSYQDANWQNLLRLQQYQTLHPFSSPDTHEIYKRLPQVKIQRTFSNLPYHVLLTLPFEYTHFSHKPNMETQETFTVGKRYVFRPALSVPILRPGWFIIPRVQWQMAHYDVTLNAVDSIAGLRPHDKLWVPIYDLNTGLIFERNTTLSTHNFIHTLEPKAYFLYVPFRNQAYIPVFDTGLSPFDFNQLYRDNRFNGLDRIGDTTQVTLGLNSRLLLNETGQEAFKIELGQIFYFKDRLNTTTCKPNSPMGGAGNCLLQELPNYNKKRSNIALQTTIQLSRISLSKLYEYNPYSKHKDKLSFDAKYQLSTWTVFNVGYQFMCHDINNINPLSHLPTPLRQWYTSAAIQLHTHWRIFGRLHYNMQRHAIAESIQGLEYQGCCTAIRLLTTSKLLPQDLLRSRNTHYERAFFVQFVLKGFAGIGHNNINSTLSQAISGYTPQGGDF